MPAAAYDEIADWYEEFVQAAVADDPLEYRRLLGELLGPGIGTCLEIGCGTGYHAGPVRSLGWTPVGIDLSAKMLRHARNRLSVARADAMRLPVADESVPAVVAMMVHTRRPS